MHDIQICEDTKISDKTLFLAHPEKSLSVGMVVVAGFCFVTAYFVLMPLIEGTHPDMPRTFFVGIGGSALVWGLTIIYMLLNHRTHLEVNMNARRVTEGWRRFGSRREMDTPLSADAVITKRVTLMSTTEGRNEPHPVTHLELKSGSSEFKLYSGSRETEWQEMIDFFGRHGVGCVEPRSGPNKWGIVGTLVFMAALLAELKVMGALD